MVNSSGEESLPRLIERPLVDSSDEDSSGEESLPPLIGRPLMDSSDEDSSDDDSRGSDGPPPLGHRRSYYYSSSESDPEDTTDDEDYRSPVPGTRFSYRNRSWVDEMGIHTVRALV